MSGEDITYVFTSTGARVRVPPPPVYGRLEPLMVIRNPNRRRRSPPAPPLRATATIGLVDATRIAARLRRSRGRSDYLTQAEAGRLLGMTEAGVRAAQRAGRLPTSTVREGSGAPPQTMVSLYHLAGWLGLEGFTRVRTYPAAP
jgi:hypothetical protein